VKTASKGELRDDGEEGSRWRKTAKAQKYSKKKRKLVKGEKRATPKFGKKQVKVRRLIVRSQEDRILQGAKGRGTS